MLLGDGITVNISLEIKRNQEPASHKIKCEHCTWSGDYDTIDTAKRAYRAHLQHCTAYAEQMQWIAEMSNGNNSGN